MPLDAAIGQLFAQYRPDRRHGHRVWSKKSSCGIVKSVFEASVQDQKVQNEASNQIIEATSCVERSNAVMKPKELS